MKVAASLLLIVVSGCMGEAPYPPSGWKPSGALLVLPSRVQNGTYGPPPPPVAYGPPQPPATYGPPNTTEDKPQEGAEVPVTPEQLRQREGATTGSYFVLLPDGRLQKVEYTTAPLQETEVQQQNGYQGQEEFNRQVFQQQYRQQNQRQNNRFQSQQYRQQSFSQPQTQRYTADKQFTVVELTRPAQAPARQVVPVQLPADFPAQPRTPNFQASADPRNNNKKVTEDPVPNPAVAQFTLAQLKNADSPASNVVASVQYSDVKPISGPVYAYNPEPLVRILRQA